MAELFSNLGIDARLLFAQAVNFLLVLWVLHRFVFKKLLKFLEERKQSIERGVELTEQAKLKMKGIGEAKDLATREAKEFAEGLIAKSKAQGAVAEKEIVEKAKVGAEQILQKAKEESERKKQDALKEAEAEIQKRAFFLAEKVLSRSLTKEDEKRMGQDLLKEIKG